jgi:tetratricopeptide (TPR) repeat protein
MTECYSAREVARILKLPDDRLRRCLRAALFSTKRSLTFTFQDLLLLKTTKGLLDARVPLARVRKILQSLKRQLPADQQLWNIRIYADGRRVVVWDAEGRWHPDSGQFLFDFEPRAVAEALPFASAQPTGTQAPTRQPQAPSSLTAEQWFDVAFELETDSPKEACEAYGRAIDAQPAFVAAHINLGRLYHEAQDLDRAERSYRAALGHAPDDACAHFNLGVLLEERGGTTEAEEAYRQAVRCDPAFQDAHYNLALLCEAQGRKADAIRHFASAQRLSVKRPTGGRSPSKPRPK